YPYFPDGAMTGTTSATVYDGLLRSDPRLACQPQLACPPCLVGCEQLFDEAVCECLIVDPGAHQGPHARRFQVHRPGRLLVEGDSDVAPPERRHGGKAVVSAPDEEPVIVALEYEGADHLTRSHLRSIAVFLYRHEGVANTLELQPTLLDRDRPEALVPVFRP